MLLNYNRILCGSSAVNGSIIMEGFWGRIVVNLSRARLDVLTARCIRLLLCLILLGRNRIDHIRRTLDQTKIYSFSASVSIALIN